MGSTICLFSSIAYVCPRRQKWEKQERQEEKRQADSHPVGGVGFLTPHSWSSRAPGGRAAVLLISQQLPTSLDSRKGEDSRLCAHTPGHVHRVWLLQAVLQSFRALSVSRSCSREGKYGDSGHSHCLQELCPYPVCFTALERGGLARRRGGGAGGACPAPEAASWVLIQHTQAASSFTFRK